MRRWTLAAAAAALFAAALWHLPAIAQRAPAPATAAADSGAAKPGTPQSTAQPAAPDLITFDAYRDFRMRYINERRARLTRDLSATDLSAAQKASLEGRKAYYDRLAAMPDKERDALFRTRFEQIDSDHDGTLDSAERAAWREKQREHYRELAAERDQKTDTLR
jgi:hypothetical protein